MHANSSTLGRGLIVAASLVTTLSASPAFATDKLVAISSGGFAEALKELATQYSGKFPAQEVQQQFGPSMGSTPQAIPARLQRGEQLDVLVMVESALDKLIAQGLVDGSTKVVLANSYIACAVPAGAVRPPLNTIADVKAAFLNAPTVAWSDSASGEYIQHTLLNRLGIESQVKAKGRQIPATPVGEIVASRQAAFGCQQRSELQPVKGIDIVGELPAEIQKVTPYAAAVVKTSKRRVQSGAFIKYLASPESAPAIEHSGLHPLSK